MATILTPLLNPVCESLLNPVSFTSNMDIYIYIYQEQGYGHDPFSKEIAVQDSPQPYSYLFSSKQVRGGPGNLRVQGDLFPME